MRDQGIVVFKQPSFIQKKLIYVGIKQKLVPWPKKTMHLSAFESVVIFVIIVNVVI